MTSKPIRPNSKQMPQAANPLAPSCSEGLPAATRKNRTILVVDNDPLILAFMTDLLSAEGYSVITAEDGLNALDVLKTHIPDIIFVDLVMPLIDGKTLLRVMRHMDGLRDAYVVILSATVAEEPQDFVRMGADACIAKDSLDTLKRSILWVLDHPDAAHSRCRAGGIIGVEGLSERRITGELLRVNARLKRMLQSLSEGILETVNGKVVFANAKVLDIIHMKEEEVLGSYFSDLFGERHRATLKRMLNGKAGSAKKDVAEVPINLSGQRLVLSALSMGNNDSDAIIIINDVTTEVEATEALERSYAQMTEMIACNRDAMVIVNRAGKIQFANPAAAELLSAGDNSVIGTEFDFPMSQDERIEMDLIDSSGNPRVAEMRVAEVTYQNEKVYLASLRDITQRKEMEENLKRANEMILRQQKAVIEEERLRVLLQLAGATSHELSQPLTTLLGHIELLMRDPELPDALAKRIEKIQASGDRISAIVRKMRSMRRYQTTPYVDGATIVDLNQKANLLLVQDAGETYAFIQEFLQGKDPIQLYQAKNISEALTVLEQKKIDLLMTDNNLKDGSAIELMDVLGERELDLPVVVISRSGDELMATRVIQAGAADYLPMESISPDTLYRSVVKALDKAHLHTELKEATEKLAQMATVDDLTGLYNRRYAMEALANEMERAKRYHTPLALCMMDLDHFKKVNDHHGHAAGDAVLSKTGDILKEGKRRSDIACRYGGEEFMLILPSTGKDGAIQLCERLREQVAAHRFKLDNGTVRITISTGISQYRSESDRDSSDLLEKADRALYQAKEAGRNRVTWAS